MNEDDAIMRFDGIADVPISDIDITNDYMFAYVMRNNDVCIELLRCLLPDKNICSIKYLDAEEIGVKHSPETQKTLLTSVDNRSVRLDVYLDDGKSIYNVEMQATSDPYLAKRARLYQAHIDIAQLEHGQSYSQLKPSYVIFFCKFDPFGRGLYRYSFQNECQEESGFKLNDETYKLFFNTTGTKGDISDRLRELLKYMNDAKAYPVGATSNQLIRMIDRRVEESLKSKEWRHAYMTLQIHDQAIALRSEQREKRQIARNMLKEGMGIDLISRITGLSVADIEALSTDK